MLREQLELKDSEWAILRQSLLTLTTPGGRGFSTYTKTIGHALCESRNPPDPVTRLNSSNFSAVIS